MRQFVAGVERDALGVAVLRGVRPDQQLVKVVNDQLVQLMGGQQEDLVDPKDGPQVGAGGPAPAQGTAKHTPPGTTCHTPVGLEQTTPRSLQRFVPGDEAPPAVTRSLPAQLRGVFCRTRPCKPPP